MSSYVGTVSASNRRASLRELDARLDYAAIGSRLLSAAIVGVNGADCLCDAASYHRCREMAPVLEFCRSSLSADESFLPVLRDHALGGAVNI
jgi:hypothetical protein